MATERTVKCGFCGVAFRTTDSRKQYCSKRHADRARNRVEPVSSPLIDDLKDFRKLSPEGRKEVLLGRAGFSVAMYDIEATHLKPNVGRILCTSFKPIGGEVKTFHALERRFKKPDVFDDGSLAVAVRDELERYDIIVGWNSKQFDTKFINSRCFRVGERTKAPQYQVDGMWSFRSKFSAWSGLKNVQKFALEGGPEKTEIAWEKWMQALGWNKELATQAMDEITHHCEMDVVVLEDVYTALVEANVIRSIRRDGGIL